MCVFFRMSVWNAEWPAKDDGPVREPLQPRKLVRIWCFVYFVVFFLYTCKHNVTLSVSHYSDLSMFCVSASKAQSQEAKDTETNKPSHKNVRKNWLLSVLVCVCLYFFPFFFFFVFNWYDVCVFDRVRMRRLKKEVELHRKNLLRSQLLHRKKLVNVHIHTQTF